MFAAMSDDDFADFKAHQEEFEAMSAYLIEEGKDAQIGYVRVFDDVGGMVRLRFESAPDRSRKVELQLPQVDLVRRAAEPQSPDPL